MKKLIYPFLPLFIFLSLSVSVFAAAVQIDTNGYLRKSGRNVVRLSNGTLIVAVVDTTAGKLKMFSSESLTEFTGTAPAGYYGCSLTADGTNWHVAWFGGATTPVLYATGSGTAYPVGETVQTAAFQEGSEISPTISITLDAGVKPHIAYVDFPAGAWKVYYTNKIGAGWSAKIQVGTTQGHHPEIAIDTTAGHTNRYNLPQICYSDPDNSLIKAALADANDPTTFTVVNPATQAAEAVNYCAPSICISSAGVTSVSSVDNSGNRYPNVAYIAESAAWGTAGNWTNQAVGSFTALYGGSLVAYGNDRWYFTGSAGPIKYSKSTNYGAWSATTQIETGGYFVKARWQYANNPDYATYGMDYIFGNDPAYWNELTVAAPPVDTNKMFFMF